MAPRWAAMIGGAVLGLLASCAPHAQPATPALWLVTAPDGAQGWLFGTIHALPQPADWHTPRVKAALDRSGELVVEIAGLNDREATAAAFQRIAGTGAPVPLAQRLPAADAPALASLIAKAHLTEASLAREKTWAAALTINAAGAADDAENGVDQALLADNKHPVAELEGAAAQFAVFDHLPEASQREMLAQVVSSAATADADSRRLAAAWEHGDMASIERETHTGLLADPTLRAALYTGRNQRWAPIIAREITKGKRPFVAVGAAHMAGAEGLVALLTKAGFHVARIE